MSDDQTPTPPPNEERRVAFCTFGCRVNQYDTESLRTLLTAQGRFRTVSARDDADVYVVNTCSVTHRADATARKMVRRIHAEHPNAQIIVTGCYAQRAPHEIAELGGVSLVLGAADRGRILDELKLTVPGETRFAVSPVEDAKTFLEVPITEMMERSRAFVKVQEGCNESCTFCIVPQTRGLSRSRMPERVLEQVGKLVDAGYAEIVLTGVHVGDYGLDLEGGRRRLAPLVRDILGVPGLARLRLSSIEPASITDEIIELVASEEKFARHFHIPLQSGNDEILARMQRRYTAGQFRNLVTKIARSIPGCGIGSDIICGFPGETDAQFQDTFDCLVNHPNYLHPPVYVFGSPRLGGRLRKLGEVENQGANFPGPSTRRHQKATHHGAQTTISGQGYGGASADYRCNPGGAARAGASDSGNWGKSRTKEQLLAGQWLDGQLPKGPNDLGNAVDECTSASVCDRSERRLTYWRSHRLTARLRRRHWSVYEKSTRSLSQTALEFEVAFPDL